MIDNEMELTRNKELATTFNTGMACGLALFSLEMMRLFDVVDGDDPRVVEKLENILAITRMKSKMVDEYFEHMVSTAKNTDGVKTALKAVLALIRPDQGG